MARLGRVVVLGLAHHVTQRGNRRMQTFFTDEDYRHYLALASEWCGQFDVSVWAYCLMSNHVHLVLAPARTYRTPDGQLFVHPTLGNQTRPHISQTKTRPKRPKKA